MNPDAAFWRGRRVLVTGNTGFKGAWLAFWLRRLGARVSGLALEPDTEPSLHTLLGRDALSGHNECDIRDAAATRAVLERESPEVVLHLAAQALVLRGYRDPLGTFAANVLGTAHVLDAVRHAPSVKVVVVVTTDKVYRNLEHAFPYRESDALGGHDPYSASKAAAEIVTASYRSAYLAERGVRVASARAGNVIGGGDWCEDRLIPDAVRAWSRGEVLQVRRPGAIRPWQHVLEPLCGYLRLAEAIWHERAQGDAYNFGPDTHEAASVERVIRLAREAYGTGTIELGDGTAGVHEAGWLALEVARARTELGVRPRWPLALGVQRTMNWYRQLGSGSTAAALCDADVSAFEATAPIPGSP